MRNARISIILWLLFPLLAAAQLPPLTRSVLTTNIPAFGSSGQALFRIAIPPYLNWSNVVASGGLSITESNNIINLASNYTWAVSNYAWTASSGLTNELTTVSNAAINASSNYTFAVSNLVVASTNGQFIEKTGGVGTNTTLRQVSQTGPALTIGTNAGAVFSIMGVTNGTSQYLVQVGSAILTGILGGTNAILTDTNGNTGIRANPNTTAALNVGGSLNLQSAYTYSIQGVPLLDVEKSTSQNIMLNASARSSNHICIGYIGSNYTMIGTSNLPNPSFSIENSQAITNQGLASVIRVGIGTNNPFANLQVVSGTTNEMVMMADHTNNRGLLSLTTNGVLTVKSNLILSSVRWVDSPVQLFWAATGPTAPNATPVVPGSQILGSGFSVGGIGTEKVYGSFQVNHNVCASNATVYTEHHLHVSPTNAPSAGSSNIAFTIVYDWSNVGGTRFGPYTNTVQIGLTAQTYNNLIEFGHQTNFFPGISAMSRCTIYRTAAASNEFNAVVILDGVDVHYPIDRLGSASDTAP